MNDFYKFKKKYKNYIVIILRGTFYNVYVDDALILNYLMNYKIREVSKNVISCGFPASALGKVTYTLSENDINYIVYEGNEESEVVTFDKNMYKSNLSSAKKYYEVSLRVDKITNFLRNNVNRKFMGKLLNEIESLIDEET